MVLPFLIGTAFAEEIAILTVLNDEDSAITTIYVDVDEDNEIQAFRKEEVMNNDVLTSESYGSELGYAGVVLFRKKGRDVVVLKSLNADAVNGGALEIDYLYNGITGSRKLYRLELDRTSDSWQVIRQGRIVETLHFRSHKKPFVGTVGIKRIDIIK